MTPDTAKTAIGFVDFWLDGAPIRIPQATGGAPNEGAGEPPRILNFDNTFSYTFNPSTRLLSLKANPGAGFVDEGRKLKTPSGSGLTVNGSVEATLAADVTFAVIVDPLSLKIASNIVSTLYPLSVTADPQTIPVRSFDGDGGTFAMHGAGALLAVRFVTGSIDDVPARSGALGVAAEAVAVAFRNAADDGDLTALGSEAADVVTLGDLTTPPTITKLYSCDSVEFYNCPDATTKLHCSFIPTYNGCGAGPIIRYSGAGGDNAQHIYPAGGAFKVYEDGVAATLRATVDDSGVDLPAAGSYQIGAAAIVSVAAGVETLGSAGAALTIQAGGGEDLYLKNGAFAALLADNTSVTLAGAHVFTATEFGAFGAPAVVKPTVTGSRGGNAALASLLTALANLGLITDSTS